MKPITTGTYKTPVNPMRQGAQDAFKKPSLVAGKRVAHTGKQIGCTGTLKDGRQHHNG